ncbi:MAG: spore germination protein [Christensenellales bacterium]|jgi:spore germination protein KA
MSKSSFNRIDIEKICTQISGVSMRVISCASGENITVLFIRQLTDRSLLSDSILKPLMARAAAGKTLVPEELRDRVLCVDNCTLDDKPSQIEAYLLDGYTVLLGPWSNRYLVSDIKKIESKSIDSPELQFTLRGARDCFIENLDTNLSLIRYRIKDPRLKIVMLEVGERTKTSVAVTYIEDIANPGIVDDIIQRISGITIDGICESGKLQKEILSGKWSLFPQTGIVERSDMACSALLEGKAIILVEGSGLGLIAPKVFQEFLTSCDDIYDNKYLALLIKSLRFIALFISITLGALYIAIISFHHDTLPSEYILTLAALRSNVPFNAFTGVVQLEIIMEIIRESLLRIPKEIGGAIGIVGAIIIGQAAIASGIYSPLLLILVSTELLSSFVVPDYTLMNPLRVLKVLMILLSALFGLIGFTLGLCVIVVTIVSSNSFGVAYATPSAPFNREDFLGKLFPARSAASKRPNFLKTTDQTRTGAKKRDTL